MRLLFVTVVFSCAACGEPAAQRKVDLTPGSGGATAGTSSSSGGAAATSSAGGASGGSGASVGGSAGSPAGGSAGSGGSGGSSGAPTTASCAGVTADPAPGPEWVIATGNLANMASACGTLGRVVAKPCSKTIVASVTNRGMWSSDDGGASWTALGSGAGSDVIVNHAFSILFDPEHPEVLWENGLHAIGGGLFTSTDDGSTFQNLGELTDTQLVSVDFGDPERKTLVAGTHGQKQKAFRSTDGGQNWENIGLTLPAEAASSESPLVIDANTYLLGVCNSASEGCGFYRTTDAGTTWTKKADLQASHFGAPLWASDGTIYWPLQFNGGLGKSTDLGETWTNVAESGVIVGVTPVELPDGSIVVVGMNQLLRSTDQGESFAPIGEPLPFSLAGQDGNITYSALRKAFFMARWECGDTVAPNAVMSAGYDFEAQ